MRVSLADLIDRFTIVTLKATRIEAKDEILEEKETITAAINEYKIEDVEIDPKWILDLYNINATIWDLEADIRDGKEEKLGLEEVGRRAIEIRNWNKKRIAVKNKITQATKTGFKEIKIQHASEEISNVE